MKKIIFLFVIFLIPCFCFSGCNSENNSKQKDVSPNYDNQESFAGAWLTCYELKNMLKDGSKTSFINNVELLLDKCSLNMVNALFVQVRPFADSIYPSDLFPLSEYILSDEGAEPEFDVLEILISLCRDKNIQIHAWINPYRISYSTTIKEIYMKYNFIDKYDIVFIDEGVYFDPSSLVNQALVLDGIREILNNYDVDGIHIDDYFYPLTDEEFDKNSYKIYNDEGGKLNFTDWRRENVNSLVSSIYSLVHSYSDKKIFSISPCGDINKNYSFYYADVKLWLEEKGYADMIIPQLYYGFENESMPFEDTAEKWMNIKREDNIKLVFGLALYKQGAADEMAGKGKNEWIESADIISRQKVFLRNSGYIDYAYFSCSDLVY